jgi:Bacteriophage baseplate protein W
MDTTGPAFPFRFDDSGRLAAQGGDEGLRARILQVLLTAPGERVHAPAFGCGLRNLVFDPDNDILAATTEFNVQAALQRWLGDEILVEAVDVSGDEASLSVEVVYTRRDQLQRGRVKIAF